MQKIKSQQYLSKKILWSNLLISCFLVSNLFGQTIPPEQDTRKTPNEQVDNPATQQNSTTPDESSGFQPLINAKSIGLSKDGTQQIFDGDVIAIGPRSLVTADKIIWDQKNKKIIAEGHVIGLSNGQYITGDKIELWTESGDAKVQNAILVVNDGGEAEKISKEILGYSISEIEFEAHRKERIDEIELKKKDLKLEARTTTKSGKELSPEIIRDYARFLEQSDLIARQENPAFAQMTEDRRQTLKRRRNFWDQARLSETLNQRVGNTSYFKLKGDFLERTNGNDLNAKNGLWTPCHCENDESPPWALRSSNIFAQPGGYATFNHAILEIKGIPVLYLPWARLPIKGVRQSGFLPPSISSDSQSGNVYSQPLFLDLGENKDVTLKTDFFEKRGTKFGFEGRYQRRQYSGFQLNLEMMRDRVWMEKRGNRVELYNLYSQGLEAARQDKSGDDISKVGNYTYRDFAVRRVAQAQYWQETEYKDCLLEDPNLRRSCEAKLFGRLRPPGNSTRGMLKWSGHERISDRISFSSSGELYSDRQYSADLYTPESFQAGFDTGSGERALQPIRAQINYDQSNYYIGLGSGVSDYVKYNDNFEGYQLPAYLKLKSRWFTLNDTLLPIYFGAGLDQLRIARVQGNKIDPEEQSDYLPPAWWRRATASVVVPLAAKSAIQVDHFTDAEARIISFNDSKNQSSSIQSLKTGFRFQLPIDGKMPLPNFLGGDAIPTEDGTRYLQHLMNWTVTISSRPNVVRKGKYGDPDDILASTTPNYLMATDAAGSYGDDNIAVEEYMNPYHLVSFQTTHRWKVFNQVWQKVETPTTEITSQKQKLKPKQEPIELTWEEKARRELLFSLDRAFIDGRELNSTDQAQWFTNKYRLLDTDYYEPVSFSASISYDYLKEQKRRSEGRTNANRPWSDADGSISFNAKGWSLSDSSRYNIYDRYFSRHALSLTPPGFLSTSTSFGYILENSISDNNGVKTFVATREKTATVVTSLTAPVYTTWSWGQKQVDGSDDAPYRQKMSFVYGSPSRCWGVGFSREKDYGQDEIAPTYRLQLNIVFMDQPRDLPDMSPTVTRELQKL